MVRLSVVRLVLITIVILAGCYPTQVYSATLPPGRPIQPMPALRSSSAETVDVVRLSYERPIIAVRFLGALCSHCMQQIVALNEKAPLLTASGTKIIAFSNNPPEKCAEAARTYKLDSNVISLCSDTDDACSRVLGTTITEVDGSQTELHAFVVLYKGQIRFEYYDISPLMAFDHVIALLPSLQKE